MLHHAEKWDLFEVRLPGPSGGKPFRDVSLTADFVHGDRTFHTTGFYDGDGVYALRFMPDAEGEWTFRTRSNVAALDGRAGRFVCAPPSPGNHGPVRVDGRHHFRDADGTFYSCIGTTSYAWVHQGDALAHQTLATLAGAPFNKLRMTVFPKSYLYNEHDDPEHFPFPLLARGGSTWDGHWESKGGRIEWRFDLERFDVAFFRMFEERIRALLGLGIVADVILFHPYDRWGFAQMPRETDLFYVRYAVARLAAFRNVWWSLANEWDCMGHKAAEDFEAIGRAIAESDPYGHPASIHNGTKWFDPARPWIAHCSVQASEFRVADWRRDYGKPVVVDELGYEGNVSEPWGNLTARELVHRCWQVAAAGGYPGHSEVLLEPDHVMWWNKGGALRGESPERIAFLRRIVESGPGRGIDPFPGADPAAAPALVCGCKGDGWILGYTGAEPLAEARLGLPAGRRYGLSHVDPWRMTVTRVPGEVAAASDGEARIALTGTPRMAFLLEATGTDHRIPEGLRQSLL